jgi:hypothetical protein
MRTYHQIFYQRNFVSLSSEISLKRNPLLRAGHGIKPWPLFRVRFRVDYRVLGLMVHGKSRS